MLLGVLPLQADSAVSANKLVVSSTTIIKKTLKINTIKKRSAFLQTQKHGVVCKKPLILVAASGNNLAAPRVGFTVSKKIGKAVTRNKIKRRLRSITQNHLCQEPLATMALDFVFIATPKTAKADFLPLQNQVKEAIDFIITQQRDKNIL